LKANELIDPSFPKVSSASVTVLLNLPSTSLVSLVLNATSSMGTHVIAMYRKQLGSFDSVPSFIVTGNTQVCAEPSKVSSFDCLCCHFDTPPTGIL
jgi:hypothetical protein